MNLINRQKNSSSPVILQLITGLGVGGAERVVLELAGRLTTTGMHSDVVTIMADSNKFLMLQQYPEVNFSIHSLLVQKNIYSIIKGIIKLFRIIDKENISLIHAHMFHSLVFAIACKIVNPNLQIVFTSHSARRFSWLRRTIICMTKSMRGTDVIFMPSQHAEMNAAKTVVIPNGVAIDSIKNILSKNEPVKRVFLFVGRLEPVKDPYTLVQSFAAMSYTNCELWIVGNGFMKQDIEREIDKLGIKDRVHVLGIRNDVPELLTKVDCFVMCSHWEGLPMAILEAGAIGLPVVATPVGAIPLLLDDECGYLTESSKLQYALDSVMSDYTEATRRGKRLQDKIAKKYSIEYMEKAHIELYNDLLSIKVNVNRSQ